MFRRTDSRRGLAAVLGATIAAASAVGVAAADDVANSLDPSIDVAAETMALNVGGTDGTTQLYITPRNGDGKQGCNLTAGSTLTVSVASSNAAVATVSPGSITFGACGDTATLKVHPVGTGSATVSLTQTANTSGATFNLAPATFTVNVAPPANTAPAVKVAGVTGGASYAKGTVPGATCEVTDAEDGASSFGASLSDVTGPYAVDGLGEQTATCSYIDKGGLEATTSETYSIVDPSAPVIATALTPPAPDGDNGWYRSDVAVDWTVSEPESPSSLTTAGCDDEEITTDGGFTRICSAASAGGIAQPVTVTGKRDATAPSEIAFGAGVPAEGGVYFPTTVPTGTGCGAVDVTSGIASCVVTGRSTAVGTHILTATATDNAGNTAALARTYRVRMLTVSGFFQPVDMGGVVNTVKAGATVPLKFTVADEGVEQTATSVVKSFAQRGVACTGLGALSDDIEITTAGATSLRFDTSARQFVQNWQTPKTAGACYQVVATLVDGSTITAGFKLK